MRQCCQTCRLKLDSFAPTFSAQDSSSAYLGGFGVNRDLARLSVATFLVTALQIRNESD